MIRIVRKIRNQTVSENNFASYLLYALGEILLVVIGILIALQLDNWNERRVQERDGEELASRLYQELEEIRDYNQGRMESIAWQANILDAILSQGPKLNLDSLFLATRDYWAVQYFTLFNYVFYFTEFYDPDYKLYSSSVNDGSIKLIRDEGFVTDLEGIYIATSAQMQRLYQRENQVNISLESYLVEHYNHLFSEGTSIKNGNWDEMTIKAVLKATLTDGGLRILLHKKSSHLRSKVGILTGVDHSIDQSLETYRYLSGN